MLERDIYAFALLVVENSVTLRERTALDILARHTHMVAFLTESTKSKCFSSGPVDVLALVNSLLAIRKNALEVSMDMEALRRARYLVGNLLQLLAWNACWVMG